MIDKVQKIREEIEKIKTVHSSVGLKESNSDILVVQVCTNLLHFIDSLQEEPVSEDLGEYINELSKQFQEVSFAKLSRIAVRVAKWQKEQFEKNRLAACDKQTEEEAEIEQSFVMGIIECEHRQPTFDDAIKYGMKLQKEQMMAKAINTEASLTMSVPSICISLPLGVNVGDKVKVIVIKEN